MNRFMADILKLPGVRTLAAWAPVRMVLRPPWRLLQRLSRERRAAYARRCLTGRALPYKVNAGSGTTPVAGWVNIDLDPQAPGVDVCWDLAQSIPVPDASCEVIYSEHMLEHLTVEQGLQFLRECHRALQVGGVVRIAMPSLDDFIDKCATGRWREQLWLQEPQLQFIESRAEMANILFRWWGHQWIYDREELHRRFREAGFTVMRDVAWGHSEVADLCHRETRQHSLLIAEAVRTEAGQ